MKLLVSYVMLACLCAAAPVRIRLATVAPRGTSLHQALLEMRQKWLDASKGEVAITLHTDGVMGGEAEMVRRMRQEEIQAAMLTVIGLTEIDPSVSALQGIPMIFRSLDEVSFVRERLQPDLEKRLLARGFVALFWADIGWVRYFSTKPAEHPADFKKLKLFAWAGNETQIALMKSAGYQPVSLEVADILPGLKNKMIEAVAQPPFFAEAGLIYRDASHMLDLNWAPMVGATVITKKAWDAIPAASRDALAAAAREAGAEVTKNGRAESLRAVAAMKAKGLTVHPVSPQIEQEWRQTAEELYPKIRGAMVPADLFDRVRGLLEEYRKKQ